MARRKKELNPADKDTQYPLPRSGRGTPISSKPRGTEHRRHVRIPVRLQAVVHVDTDNIVIAESREGFAAGTVHDLSEGGAMIETTRPIKIRTPVIVEFALSDQSFAPKAIVRWTRNRAVGRLRAGMGVQFLDLSEEEQTAIRIYLLESIGKSRFNE